MRARDLPCLLCVELSEGLVEATMSLGKAVKHAPNACSRTISDHGFSRMTDMSVLAL